MRAAAFARYGPPEVVEVVDRPTPQPKDDQVVVKVIATAVTAADSRIREARFPRGFTPFARLAFGVTKPRKQVLGNTFSGVVHAVGAAVDGVRVGDAVCGTTGARMGTHAEFVAVPAKRTVAKPAAVSHDDAAGLLFGGTTALYFLRDRAHLAPGARVLVNGASGAVGTSAVQLAVAMGARVIAVTSTPNLELMRDLGAADVIDYTSTDLTDVSDRFDVVLDTVGTVDAKTGRAMVADGGTVLLAVADLWQMIGAHGNVKAGSATERPADVAALLDLASQGELRTIIDSVFALDDVVAAHARVDTGRKVGNVILTM